MKKRALIFAVAIVLLSLNLIYSQTQKIKSFDGVEIAYTMKGSGEPALIFIHGWCCDKSYWDDQVKVLSPRYTVVAIDLGGFGESGTNRENWTMEAYGEDVAAVVNKLGLQKVILIGHSLGGSVILEAAKLLKGKVIGLIGADTFQSFKDDWTAEQKEGFIKQFKENFSESTKQFVKALFPETADTTLVNKVANDMSSADPKVAVSAMRNLFFYDPVPTLKELQLPIISINSDMIPVAVDDNMKYVKSFEVKIMHNVGHFIMLEKPEEFNKLGLESVNELTGSDK